jgi:DNA-binding Lrp family transcriptional regulator
VKRKRNEMLKDKVDEKIIEYLKENSRESFVDIGKKLKLSESAVRRRVKNLVDSNTIKRFTLEMGEENVTSS